MGLLFVVASIGHSKEILYAGASAKIIKTPDKIALAGYIQRRILIQSNNPNAKLFKPSLGIIDNPRVKVIVLRNKEQTLAFVSMDLIAVHNDMRLEIYERTKDVFSNSNQIQLFATHTHSGPGGYVNMPFWEHLAVDKINPSFHKELLDTAEKAIRESVKNLEPALIGQGEMMLDGFTMNRRNSNTLNPRLNLIKISNLRNKNIANILNFPIHGTFFPPANLMLSRDIPGAIEQSFENKTNAVSLFISGPAGDVGPVIEEKTPKALSLIGEEITQKAYQLWSSTKVKAAQRIEILKNQFTLVPANVNVVQCLAAAFPETFAWLKKMPWFIKLPNSLNIPSELYSIRVEDILILTVPGEPITQLGIEIEKLAALNNVQKPMIFTLANNYMGYVLTKEEFLRGGYETCNSFYGESYGDQLIQSMSNLIRKL